MCVTVCRNGFEPTPVKCNRPPNGNGTRLFHVERSQGFLPSLTVEFFRVDFNLPVFTGSVLGCRIQWTRCQLCLLRCLEFHDVRGWERQGF